MRHLLCDGIWDSPATVSFHIQDIRQETHFGPSIFITASVALVTGSEETISSLCMSPSTGKPHSLMTLRYLPVRRIFTFHSSKKGGMQAPPGSRFVPGRTSGAPLEGICCNGIVRSALDRASIAVVEPSRSWNGIIVSLKAQDNPRIHIPCIAAPSSRR